MEKTKTGRVWSKFSTKKPDGTVINMYIEDISDETHSGWVELYGTCFVEEEPFQRASGIYKSKDAVAEYDAIKKVYFSDPKQHIVVCCIDTDSGKKVVGASAMKIETPEDDLNFETQTKEVRKLLEIIKYLSKFYDVFTDKNINTYYAGKGIAVHPDFRRMGIGRELIRTRRLISKEHGIPYTMAWMTARGTQKAAGDDGWETVVDIPYKDLGEKLDVVFDNAPPNCKLMVAKAME